MAGAHTHRIFLMLERVRAIGRASKVLREFPPAFGFHGYDANRFAARRALDRPNVFGGVSPQGEATGTPPAVVLASVAPHSVPFSSCARHR